MFTDLIPQQLTPQEQKWSDEAATVGLTFVKRTKLGYGLFIINLCKHQIELSNSNARRNKFLCKICKEEDLRNNAKQNKIKYINKTKYGYALYEFIDCNHTQEIASARVKSKEFRCAKCFENNFKKDASESNLIWIKQSYGNHGLYIFKFCGHERILSNASVRNKKFKCLDCYNKKLKDESLSVNLAWLKQTFKGYGLFKFNKCGHTQEIKNSNVRRKVFQCQTCEDTWFTKPSNVYVHIISLQGETFVKVGRAQNVENRINGYGLPSEAVVQTVLEAPTKTGKDANDIETKILQKFKRFRAKNIGHIMTKSGSTECFDASKLSEILDFTKAIAGVK